MRQQAENKAVCRRDRSSDTPLCHMETAVSDTSESRSGRCADTPLCHMETAVSDTPESRSGRCADTSLYLHIPFCVKKCNYCDFLSAPRDEGIREQYVQALIREIRCQRISFKGTCIDTIFIGGGTPSLLTEKQTDRIMEAVYASFSVRPDAEISMEMNPGTADRTKLSAFRKAGINRLSIGVQSLHDKELRLLGRIHTAAQAKSAYRMAREAGFDNINLDLISALPGQVPDSWEDSLTQAVLWRPEHISAYSLIIEEGTVFADWQEKGQLPPLPEEEADRTMYRRTEEILGQAGYRQYEISNYALPGKECRHNTGYWTGHDYLGLGLGAASCVRGCRFSNTDDLALYLEVLEGEKTELNEMPDRPERPAEDRRPADADTGTADPADGRMCLAPIRCGIHQLTESEKMEEFMFLGIESMEFERRFGTPLESVYGDVIRKHIRQGLAERTPRGLRLTRRGIDVSNYVLADYLF